MASKRGTKRKGDAEPELSDASLRFSAKSGPKRDTMRSKGQNLLSRLDEEDKDEVLDKKRGSPYYIEWMAEGNRQEAIKSKESTKSFVDEVDKQKQQLVEFLDSQEEMLKESHQKLVSVLANAYSSVMPSSPANPSPGQAFPESQDIVSQAQQIIDTSRSLSERYKRTDEELAAYQPELSTSTWRKDKQDIKELLACGREHGEKLVESYLSPDSDSPPQHDVGFTGSGHAKAASEMFPKSHKIVTRDTWGMVAAEQLEGFKMLAGI